MAICPENCCATYRDVKIILFNLNRQTQPSFQSPAGRNTYFYSYQMLDYVKLRYVECLESIYVSSAVAKYKRSDEFLIIRYNDLLEHMQWVNGIRYANNQSRPFRSISTRNGDFDRLQLKQDSTAPSTLSFASGQPVPLHAGKKVFHGSVCFLFITLTPNFLYIP